jgi:hypothetical protein
MKRTRSVFWFAAMVLSAATLWAQANHPLRMVVDDPRPVASGAEQLEARYGWVITYEDPQWLAPSEIRDVTDSVRRDAQGLSPQMRSMLPRVLIPRGGSFVFSLPLNGSSDQLVVVQNLLAAYASAGNPGTFRVLQSPGAMHIIPVTARDATEQSAPQHPVLDATISLEKRSWTGAAFLEAFCKQLTLVSGQRVEVGIFPINTLGQFQADYDAWDEPARDVLSRFLHSIGPGYSWQLFFDPSGRSYYLNIHWVGSLEVKE